MKRPSRFSPRSRGRSRRRSGRRIEGSLGLGLGLGLALALGLLAHCGSSETTGSRAATGVGDRSGEDRPPVSSERGEPEARPPTVILISLDGTRPADLNEAVLPSLVALGRQGVRAEGLVPVNPTNTFPNHVSLATGVRPEVHRLVNNAFVDPERGAFDREAPNTWIESEPIWSIAERHGLPAASFYWVGSEGAWGPGPMGPGPSRTEADFSSRTTEREKVDRILEWLEISDPAERPRLILSWFHGADHAGHVDGPGAASVAQALAPQDREITRLVQAMERRALFESTTLIFVSDHGMASAQRRVGLSRELARAGLEVSVLGIGGFASIVFDEGEKTRQNVERTLSIARAAGLEAWERASAPSDWHVDDVRFGDVVVRAPIGTALVGRMTLIDGFHGYAASAPEMAGILVARGRGVASGARIGRVSSLSLAPTVLTLLGLPIPSSMEAPPIAALLELPPPSSPTVEGEP
ncbi:MAG: alkaline phosphatase family protein [bacterium]